MTEEVQKLEEIAPDGKPWREDALILLGASKIVCHIDGPCVEPPVDLAKYSDAVQAANVAHFDVVRRERDARLTACDWTQLPDNGLPKAKAAAWKTYRQALRDMPTTTVDPVNPNWPIPPEK